jgi:hypothetical protein
MILLGRALMVLAALPEEDAPREREERRKGFALGMQEAEAIVRKQRTEGMGMVDATKARDAAADCISIRACAFAAMFAAPASPPSVTPGAPPLDACLGTLDDAGPPAPGRVVASTPTPAPQAPARIVGEVVGHTPEGSEVRIGFQSQPPTCPDGYTHDHDCTDLGCNGTGRRTP